MCCNAVWIVKKKNQKKITENVTMPIKVQDCKEKKENEFDKIFGQRQLIDISSISIVYTANLMHKHIIF